MDLHGDDTWIRLDRWVRAEGTPEELEALRRWVESDPELQAMAEAMRTVGRPADGPHRWNAQGRWQRLQREMRQADRPLRLTEAEARSSERRVPLERPRRYVAVVAAAAAIAIVTGATLWMSNVHLQPA